MMPEKNYCGIHDIEFDAPFQCPECEHEEIDLPDINVGDKPSRPVEHAKGAQLKNQVRLFAEWLDDRIAILNTIRRTEYGDNRLEAFKEVKEQADALLNSAPAPAVGMDMAKGESRTAYTRVQDGTLTETTEEEYWKAQAEAATSKEKGEAGIPDEISPLVLILEIRQLKEENFNTKSQLSSITEELAKAKKDMQDNYRPKDSFSPIESLERQLSAMAGERDAALKEVEEHRKDLEDAAGELLVSLPLPGTEAAKMLRANRLIRNQRDDAREEANEYRTALQTAEAMIIKFGLAGTDNFIHEILG